MLDGVEKGLEVDEDSRGALPRSGGAVSAKSLRPDRISRRLVFAGCELRPGPSGFPGISHGAA